MGNALTENEKEIIQIKFLLEKIEGIIDSRLIGEEDPEEDEVKEILDFEKKEKSWGTEIK